ncbi:hypothetical protein PZA11_000950 [Diplocarpon coronariae]|uniref:Ubiquitin 3 binding protein But2 C-terminal domain-containing protein n=1 Tax=Diplocarpon coronariae TaxID=2795749 RepID=A0A218ZCX8_9HELO|nr:igE-binding protein [Diplocarpon mali]OWP05602.1 hypothetical protein B2J93_1651 [Marssonina coronariae]
MFTKTAILSLLASFAVAAPTSTSADVPADNPNVFSGFAVKSGSAIQGYSINANSLKFNLNNGTKTYCPPNSNVVCSLVGTTTVFLYRPESKSLFLDGIVAGGQQVYVAGDGSLSFTGAHSGALLDSSSATPFEYSPQKANGDAGYVTFDGKSFTACPADLGSDGTSYLIYALARTEPTSTCIAFRFQTALYDGAVPYQYE